MLRCQKRLAIAIASSFSLVGLTLIAPAVSLPISMQVAPEYTDLIYNVTAAPNLQPNQALQTIVDDIVNLVVDRGFAKESLSISLIDLNTNTMAEYQQNQPRYPASIVKLFWMVIVYAKIQQGILPETAALNLNLSKMIGQSNNESASRILDTITNTESGEELKAEDYQIWLKKRQQVNQFFQSAGYQNLNISQKTFPIPYLNQELPEGRDLQMRGDPDRPIRNQLTTADVARLLYEIAYGRSVSKVASQKMLGWLTRDLHPEAWKNLPNNSIELNPIRELFGESLPVDLHFASKAGWTSNSRQEAALIATKDGKTSYILVVFANDSAYAADENIFPKISRLVFERMTGLTLHH